MLLFFLALAGSLGQHAPMVWKDLFVSDCKGGVHILPNTPLEMNGNKETLDLFIDFALDELYETMTCACPTLTKNDFKAFVMPSLEMVLSAGRGSDYADFQAAADNFESVRPSYSDPLKILDHSKQTFKELGDEIRNMFPPSCTYDRYVAGKGCAFQFPIKAFDVKIKAIIAQCPSTFLPFVNIQCSGPGCEDLGKPCQDFPSGGNDCGGPGNTAMTCHKVAEAPSTADVYNILKEIVVCEAN